MMSLFDRAQSYVTGEKKMEPKFKVGPAKTSGGYDAVIYEILENAIYGRMKHDFSWRPMQWENTGRSVGWDQAYDLLPNNIPAPQKLLAYLGDSGLVKYALEGSVEAVALDRALAMKRAPRFDIKESEL